MTQKSDYERIVELWRKGLDVAAIRSRLGVSKSTIYKALTAAGLSRSMQQQRRGYAEMVP